MKIEVDGVVPASATSENMTTRFERAFPIWLPTNWNMQILFLPMMSHLLFKSIPLRQQFSSINCFFFEGIN